jgi:hypothetical protein
MLTAMNNSDINTMDTGDLRSAEDAIQVLRATADLLEEGGSAAYAQQLRRDAAAVASLTSRHRDAQDLNTLGGAAAREHRSLLRQQLSHLFIK